MRGGKRINYVGRWKCPAIYAKEAREEETQDQQEYDMCYLNVKYQIIQENELKHQSHRVQLI